MADPVLQLLPKQEKEKLPNVPGMKELPPTPTITANIASLSGRAVSFSDANESWTNETPRSYQPPDKQRKRAQAELFRHFTLQQVVLSVSTNPCTPVVYDKDKKTIEDVESEACKNSAGVGSFLFTTVKGIVEIANITTNAHNIYREGRQMATPLPDPDETSARNRSVSSRARIEKAVEDLERL